MERKIKKFEKKADKLKQTLETFAQDLANLMQKLARFLKTKNKMELLGSLSDYPDERKEFREDLKGHGLGIFLWGKERYPNISGIFESVGFWCTVFEITEIKRAIQEYDQFIEMVRQKNKDLVEIEINETYKIFFNTSINPIEILVSKSHLWRKIDENTSLYIDLLFKTLPAIEIYFNILERVVKVESARFKVKSKRRKGEGLFKLTSDTFKRINREFSEKCPPEVIKPIQDLGDLGKNIIKDISYIDEHKKEDFYNLLELTKDLHEFHIDLVKYLLRLWHIYENGNRDYVNNYKIEYHFPNLNTIINHYIKKNLTKYCPNLSRVIIGFFLPFEKFRHIESHTTPELKISDDKKIIYIPKKGRKSQVKVNIDNFKTSIRTYICFIEALRIYR